jgi:hypothetical protein
MMDKAERRNHRKLSGVQQAANWRAMVPPGSDTSDTEDKDCDKESRHRQPDGSQWVVTLTWRDGRVVGLPRSRDIARNPLNSSVSDSNT